MDVMISMILPDGMVVRNRSSGSDDYIRNSFFYLISLFDFMYGLPFGNDCIIWCRSDPDILDAKEVLNQQLVFRQGFGIGRIRTQSPSPTTPIIHLSFVLFVRIISSCGIFRIGRRRVLWLATFRRRLCCLNDF